MLMLFACSKEVKKSQAEITLNISGEPGSLDPRKARDLISIDITLNLFEGLTRINKEGQPQLALAESYQVSPDGKTYTFILRKAFWSNGDKIRAQDFVYSWEKVLAPDFPAPMAYLMFIIEGAKEAKLGSKKAAFRALNEKTFIVHLEKPVPYFLDLLALPIFTLINEKVDRINPHFAEKVESFVCNGPFKIATWKNNDKIELVKNSFYWDKKTVKLEKISLIQVSPEAEIALFEESKLDWLGSPLSTFSLDAAKKMDKIYKTPCLSTTFLRINHHWIKEQLVNKKEAFLFLEALEAAINREFLAKYVLEDTQTAAFSFLPPPWQKEKKGRSLEEILVFLSKSNFPKELRMIYINRERNHRVAQALQRDWEDNLPLKIKLVPVEIQLYYEILKTGNYELALSNWMADFPDPVNFLEIFKSKDNGTNNTFWENAEYTALLNRIQNCQDNKQRERLVCKAENILMQEKPIIPLYYLNLNYLKNPKIQGEIISALGHIDLKEAYIKK